MKKESKSKIIVQKEMLYSENRFAQKVGKKYNKRKKSNSSLQ